MGVLEGCFFGGKEEWSVGGDAVHNAVGVGGRGGVTQGSECLATLGFRA